MLHIPKNNYILHALKTSKSFYVMIMYLLIDVGLANPTGLGRCAGRGRGAGALFVLIFTGHPSIVFPPAA